MTGGEDGGSQGPDGRGPTLIAQVAGGVGVFLLGMILLTDGLRSAAGGALRGTLERFTGGRISAVLSGAAITALVQSSSATTLATIGFVSAGLLTFPAAVGVIFGANLGTSSTGWIVSVLGLKFQIGAVALPLVAVGALLRLLGRGRWAHTGMALAGFGLIFVGIDLLQVGMATLTDRFDPGRFPVTGVRGRLLLVALGVGMTVVMQSSSAAVATTLTALHSGAITLEQGALLVIGQNVGTTVTAGIAAIGASTPARRTALAHVLFNVVTGLVAYLTLPLLLAFDGRLVNGMDASDPAVALAAFHTTFNLLGVLLLVPVIDHFSRMVERLVPDRGPVLGRHLDRSLVGLPTVAVAAARRAVAEVAVVTTGIVRAAVRGVPLGADDREALDRGSEALARIRDFLRLVETAPESGDDFDRHLAVLHALDHQERLVTALREEEEVNGEVRRDLLEMSRLAAPGLDALAAWLEGCVSPQAAGNAAGDGGGAEPPQAVLAAAARDISDYRRRHRVGMLADTATGRVTPAQARTRMMAVRRNDRLMYHIWRSGGHLAEDGAGPDAPPAPPTPPSAEPPPHGSAGVPGAPGTLPGS